MTGLIIVGEEPVREEMVLSIIMQMEKGIAIMERKM